MERLTEQLDAGELGTPYRQRSSDDVVHTLFESARESLRKLLANVELQIRIALVKFGHYARQKVRTNGRWQSEPQEAGKVFTAARGECLNFVGVEEHAAGDRHDLNPTGVRIKRDRPLSTSCTPRRCSSALSWRCHASLSAAYGPLSRVYSRNMQRFAEFKSRLGLQPPAARGWTA
jgi:hypothetical protein